MVNNMKTIFLALISLMFLGSGFAYAGDYANSAHGHTTSGVDRTTIDAKYDDYTPGNCAHCHEAHASLDGAEPTPVKPGPDEVLLFDYEEDLCETCHDGDPAADNIKAQIDKDATTDSTYYAHPTDDYSGRHSVSESKTTDMAPGDYATRHAECVDCHNPHAVESTVHTQGTNAVSSTSPIYKVSGVSPPSTAAWSTPSAVSYTEKPTSTGISYEYELCFKCHSNWTTQPGTQTNIALQFNPANASYHSVEDTGKASAYGTYVSTWDKDDLMYCSDCHGSETSSDPAGPHGSTIDHILKGEYDRNTGKSGLDTSDHLCFICHDYQTYKADGTNSTGSGFAKDQMGEYVNYHTNQKHGSGKGDVVCMDCHAAIPHGINRKHLIVYTTDDADYINGAKITNFINVDDRTYSKSDCTAAGCH